jgi:cytochrome c biogenesis protein CcmG/thiol:disulfide interchange protein DsbE
VIRRFLPLVVFCALAVLLFAGIRLNETRDPNAIPSPLIGKPAPQFSLPDFRDPSKQISNADLKGRPYLLNVWGSWCPTCRIEHPIVSALAKRNLVQVVGYNWKDTPEDAQRWLQQFGDPYDRIMVDQEGRTAIDWGITAAPESFLVDANGIVLYKQPGAIDYEVLEKKILPLLGVQTP